MITQNEKRHKHTPLLLKISIAVFATAVILFAVFAVIQIQQDQKELTENLQTNAERLIKRLPGTLVYPMFNFETDRINFILEDVFSDELVIGIELYEGDTLTVELKADDFEKQPRFPLTETIIFNDGGEDLELGQVTLYFTKVQLQKTLRTKMIQRITSNLLFAVIIMLVNAYILFRIVVKPIKQTSVLLASISEGEGDLTQSLLIKSGDEIGELAGHFNIFVSKLNQIIGNIKINMNSTITIKDDLSSHTEETVAAVEEMISNIESSKKQIAQLDDTAGESIKAVDRIRENIDKTVRDIGEQGTMVEQATAAITEMLSSIDSVAEVSKKKKDAADILVRTADRGNTQVNETSEIISEIAQSVDQIEEMLELINSIASQTNILSMNAAIEAAHAGESGKGFAVVADEIRKLAESSGQNAKSIADVLTTMINKIESATVISGSLQKVFAQVDSEVNDVADSLEEITTTMVELSSGSEQIQNAMSGLMDVSRNVMSSSEEMKSGAGVLDKTVNQVGDVASSVTGAMEELVVGTREIGEAMANSNMLNRDLGTSADELRQLVEKFKTNNESSVEEASI